MMAGKTEEGDSSLPKHLLADISKLLWGPNLKEEVFQRWSQGFVFSEDEATALVQLEGGPCAVIVPVQAFLLVHALFKDVENWRDVPKEAAPALLVNAMCDVLRQCCNGPFYAIFVQRRQSPDLNVMDDDTGREDAQDDASASEDVFHSLLRLRKADTIEDTISMYREGMEILHRPFSVLAFLYSVILTKGIDQIKNEMEDPNEPLVDGTYGHGSQSLINLMLTGTAVSNVWDNEKDISGLKLQGISMQSTVGFLTLLEHLRYCEVGWFLKCPVYPIWIVGSETHLTILFSKEKSLVSPETTEAAAKRIFKTFDPEGNNFISAVLLADVLKALDLFADPEYVEMMKQKLDSDDYGIILLSSFMNEFYPNESKSNQAQTFVVYHYNGLKRSSPDGKVKFQEGRAVFSEDDVQCFPDLTPILKCLQTKWPGIEVQWTSGISPSII